MTQRRQHLNMVYLFVIAAWLVVSLFPGQAVYAEQKKVSGTGKDWIRLGFTHIKSESLVSNIPIEVLTLRNHFYGIFRSADPDWNNATFYSVDYADALKASYKGYAVTTHPGDNQTFLEYEGTWEMQGIAWTSQAKGRFLGGTGKFKGITGKWTTKTKATETDVTTEWEAEYEIKQ